MAKTGKSTKKFQSKHLKHTLEHRRNVQKHNKTVSQRRGGKSKAESPVVKKKANAEIFEDMSVEDFFEKGFEVPKPKKSSRTTEHESADSSIDEDLSDDMELDDSVADEEEEEKEVLDEEEDEASKSSEENSGSDDESSEEEDEAAMEENMKKLAENDPEFFNYLKSNDKALLDFEGVNPMDAISEDESDEQASGDEETSTEPKRRVTEITEKLLSYWREKLSEPNAKSLLKVVAAFKSGVRSTNEEYTGKYTVTDPTVFTDFMLLGLKEIPEALLKLAPLKTNKKTQRTVDGKLPTALVRISKYYASTLILILQDITNTETAALVLTSAQEIMPYLVSERKILKEVLSAIVNVWASTDLVDTQVTTYAFLNNAAREYPKEALEIILKLTYSSFLKSARKTNPHSADLINFSKNSAVELYGIDEQLAYGVGFEYVRQLAVHLRNTITSTSNVTETKNKDAYKAIYNWQFCHSLDFWSRVLAQHCNPEKELLNHKNHESPLRSLIYPLVQVTLGTIRLIPTPLFFPLRFYLIRALIRLSQGTGVYIPVFPLIAEILVSSAFTKPGKPSNLPALEFEHLIRASQQYLTTKVYQEGLCEEFLELTSEFFVLYSKNVAFPELITPAVLSLRRFAKRSRLSKFNKQLSQLIEKLTANAEMILKKRASIEYGPSNKAEVKAFMRNDSWETTPLGKYVVVQRKVREQRRKLLREARQEDEKAKTESAQKSLDADLESEEEDEEMLD